MQVSTSNELKPVELLTILLHDHFYIFKKDEKIVLDWKYSDNKDLRQVDPFLNMALIKFITKEIPQKLKDEISQD